MPANIRRSSGRFTSARRRASEYGSSMAVLLGSGAMGLAETAPLARMTNAASIRMQIPAKGTLTLAWPPSLNAPAWSSDDPFEPLRANYLCIAI